MLRHLCSERKVTQSCLWFRVRVRVRVRVGLGLGLGLGFGAKALVLGEEVDAILFVVKKSKCMFGIDCLATMTP